MDTTGSDAFAAEASGQRVRHVGRLASWQPVHAAVDIVQRRSSARTPGRTDLGTEIGCCSSMPGGRTDCRQSGPRKYHLSAASSSSCFSALPTESSNVSEADLWAMPSRSLSLTPR